VNACNTSAILILWRLLHWFIYRDAYVCRYYNLLLEFDIDTLTMRAVECVSKGDCPDKRAQCLIAAYSLPSSSGSHCHHVVCGYGYTTFNHASQRYQVSQAMSDMWKCTLVAEAATASHAPLNEPEIAVKGNVKLGPGQHKVMQV
jgi:hypothetical protein